MSLSVFLTSNFSEKRTVLDGDYNQLKAKLQFWLHVGPKDHAD